MKTKKNVTMEKRDESWRKPLPGELDFETDCHFPTCGNNHYSKYLPPATQVNHNFCPFHHRYFDRIEKKLREVLDKEPLRLRVFRWE